MEIRLTMLLFVIAVLIGREVYVSAAHDGDCFLHDVFESFSNEKVKLALTARDVEVVKKELRNIKKQIAKIHNVNQNPVAFFAKNTKHKAVTGGHKLTYDTVVTDTYRAFDKSTGTFICPKPGVYIFHFNALNHAGKLAYFILYKNGSEVVRALADDKRDHESSGNTALLQLETGDTIYVKIPVNYAATLYEQYNTFSGHMISC